MPHAIATMPRLTISLTAKIVLLVAFMGVAFAFIHGYSTWHMKQVEQQYQTLLELQRDVGNRYDTLRQHLGRISTAVYVAMTAKSRVDIHTAEHRLRNVQRSFDANVRTLESAFPQLHIQLTIVQQQAQHVFAAAEAVIQARLEAKDLVAEELLSEQLIPALERMRAEVDILRSNTQQALTHQSQALQAENQATLYRHLLATWMSVVLIAALTASLAFRLISKPIKRLTHSMQRMRAGQYDTPIPQPARHDEIGSMARALQQFATELKNTQALQHERLLRQKNELLVEHLQQLTSALPGAVFQLALSPNNPLKLRFVSPQWISLLGLPEDTPTDLETAAAHIRGHDAQVTAVSEKNFAQSAQTLEPVNFEVRIDRTDSSVRWIKTRANPVRQPDGSVIFNGVWLDVTKETQQAQALKKAKVQAEQDAQARTVLQASISHEIRTPLNAILGLTQLILKTDLPPAQRAQLNNVLRASQHLRGIVNEVLDFSKIDAGQLKLESTDFSLTSVVQDVMRMCQEDASKKQLPLSYQIAPEVPDALRGDPHRIAQILLNYVNNAIKFTTAGHIHIHLQLLPSSSLHRVVLRASVTDTGPGIPADRIQVLFEAFQQADNSITRRFGGTGLGLTISRALAQLMGGSAGVESVLGKGSTFWFTAVLEPARSCLAQIEQPAQQLIAQQPNWQGLRVLVVDDQPLNRAVAQGMLQSLGLSSDTAEDGTQALELLRREGPEYYSCVLMDIQMPQMDGISATRALRAMPGFEKLPVIAMTAHTGLHDVQNAQKAGMNAHLSKPLLESSLSAVLQAWLDCHSDASVASNEPAAPAMAPASIAELPSIFAASAVDEMADLFTPDKLQQLAPQFVQDSLQRVHAMRALLKQQDWPSMRAEAHKLSGTAATFGLLQLEHWSRALSATLKAGDSTQLPDIVEQLVQSTEAGAAQLQAYINTLFGRS